ncbi:MAG: 2,3-bisphosphoglycerate-independent phosphoglycerate mutase [Chloroflexi bacterium]|nr:2,3-bisphosphoglycerate-independent phosphoglycerate mutase [Chloroflexota bacterium]
MADLTLMSELARPNGSKMVLLVMDGLGGLPLTPEGKTELETAHTPHMDRLAREGSTGLHIPIAPGVTPGSGPAHLALFSYNPVRYEVGRGVLETLGIGFDLQPQDVAARGNFCTMDEEGRIIDRRAGRISTEECIRLTRKLQERTHLPGVEIFVLPVKEHRFALVLRGEGLSDKLSETDPLVTGKPPLPVRPLEDTPEARRTAELVNQWIAQAREVLKDEPRANCLNLRGWGKDPQLPQFTQIYRVKAGAIAVYPMYRGVARLVGMELLSHGSSIEEEFAALKAHWDAYDFFFLHVKPTDSRGEDGDFQAKVQVIEEVDRHVGELMELKPDVLLITGDHATPAKLRSHSWHPVPFLLWAENAMPDGAQAFGERECAKGYYSVLPAPHLVPLMMGHAGRLSRFGA